MLPKSSKPSFKKAAHYEITNGTAVNFASAAQGRKIITAKDDYISRLSLFDYQSKMKSNRNDIQQDEFLDFFGANTMKWNKQQKNKIVSALNVFNKKAANIYLPLPKKVFFVKTTGQEESEAAYTRANAIFLPESFFHAKQERIDWVVAHELFHVLTRANPELKEQLYKTIGFKKTDEIELPSPLRHYKISNPDAPVNDHVIKVQIDGKDQWTIPVIYSDRDYVPEKEQNFFRYLKFSLLLVERDNKNLQKIKAVLDRKKKPKLADPDTVKGFFDQIGTNTDYIIHPEEILAENFVHMLMKTKDLPTPEIISRMSYIIKDYGRKMVGTTPHLQ